MTGLVSSHNRLLYTSEFKSDSTRLSQLCLCIARLHLTISVYHSLPQPWSHVFLGSNEVLLHLLKRLLIRRAPGGEIAALSSRPHALIEPTIWLQMTVNLANPPSTPTSSLSTTKPVEMALPIIKGSVS